MCRIKGLDTSGVPIGVMHDFGQAALPFGYLACDGAAVSRTTYAALFAKVGTTYGVGDGSTTFNLPNGIGRSKIMPGSYTDPVSGAIVRTAGQAIGAERHINTIAELPSHDHGGGAHGHSLKGGGTAIVGIGVDGASVMGATSPNGSYNNIVNNVGAVISPQGSGNSHNNMQPSLVVGNVGIAYI
jgi:microcystin-dependent protein